LISEARAYAAQIVPEARGQAQRVRTVAEGYKTASVVRAQGDGDRFSMVVDAYKAAPDVTRKRLWLETMQEVLGGNRKIVGGDSRQLIYVPMAEKAGTKPAAAVGAPNAIMNNPKKPMRPINVTRNEATAERSAATIKPKI
jgi:membrane protease subunit HflK